MTLTTVYSTLQNDIFPDDLKQDYLLCVTQNDALCFRTTQNEIIYDVQYSTTQNNSKKTNCYIQYDSKRRSFLQNNSKRDYL